MTILFQNILFLKEFLACNGFFGLFTKVKKGSGNSLWCIFSEWFSNNNVCSLFNSLSMDKVSVPHLISLKISKKCVIKYLFRQLIKSQTLRFIFHQPLKQWLPGRKRGEGGNKKIWISRERKELFTWNKKHFS